MIDHTGVIVSDFERSKTFYQQTLAAIGYELLMEAPNQKPTTAEMIHFLDCIETGATPRTTPEDSLKGLQVIWKLYEAEDSRKIADLRGLGF